MLLTTPTKFVAAVNTNHTLSMPLPSTSTTPYLSHIAFHGHTTSQSNYRFISEQHPIGSDSMLVGGSGNTNPSDQWAGGTNTIWEMINGGDLRVCYACL
jgi:hypothetical protein